MHKKPAAQNKLFSEEIARKNTYFAPQVFALAAPSSGKGELHYTTKS
jgi:hypothetical protein